MEPNPLIRALFLDIGGVLLTNGWDREARRQACESSMKWTNATI
jgi:putative hydrolase of the HAD superfamily